MDKNTGMTLSDLHISYINLKHRTDRKVRMEHELKKAGIVAQRFEAIKTADHFWDKNKYGVMLKRSPGAVGCHVSQCEVMEEGLRLNKSTFVMEDDLVVCSDFHKRFEYVFNYLENKPWDIVWMGATFHTNPPHWNRPNNPELPDTIMRKDAECTNDPRIMRTYAAFSTHAYVINVNSIEKVLKYLDENVHLSMGIDWLMIRMQPELFTYTFVPGCIKQYDGQSDIGRGITYYSGFSRLGPYWWQDKMEDFDPTTYNWHEASNK